MKDAQTEAEFVRRLGEKAKSLAPGQWILGGNWDEQAWPSAKLPTRKLIDAVTAKNPVFISRYDGHAALANSLALKMAGVTKNTPDPAGRRHRARRERGAHRSSEGRRAGPRETTGTAPDGSGHRNRPCARP